MNRVWFFVFALCFTFAANAEKSEIEKRIEQWERTNPQYVPKPSTPTRPTVPVVPPRPTTPAPSPYQPIFTPPKPTTPTYPTYPSYPTTPPKPTTPSYPPANPYPSYPGYPNLNPAPIPAPAVPAETVIRNPSTYRQEQTKWCWAAVTQSIASTVGAGNYRQCEMASRFIAYDSVNNPCCGARAGDAICNQGYFTNESMSTYKVLNQTYNYALAQSTLAQEFKAGNPVAITVVYSPTHAHALMLYGVGNDRNLGDVVYGFDPDVLGKFVKARSEVERNRDYRWEATFTSSNNRR